MTENDKKLAEKLHYLIDNHYIKAASDITQAFGFRSNTMVSNLKNINHSATLNRLHMDGLEKYFQIPPKIFDSDVQTEEIGNIIKEYKDALSERGNGFNHNHSTHNNKLFKKLKGEWYAYLYPSNPKSAVKSKGVWIIKTTITEDYRVVDEWKNEGVLQIGQNQSLIIKESYDERDLTVIRFQNRQVSYGSFRFVIISTQNGSENEMINFGFYSKKKYSPKKAKEILGDLEKVQLKLDLDFYNAPQNQDHNQSILYSINLCSI